MGKRKLKLAVISDVHLGTYGCQAKSLYAYLKSIDPEILILNGDIVDIWQFSKSFWPDSHMKVVQRIFKMMSRGTEVYYLTGNHDEMLRKFTDFKMGRLHILNKLSLTLDGKKAWFFHGDIFDVTMRHSKWLAKLGGMGYDLLILVNSAVNWVSQKFGRGRISLSKKIKYGVKRAIQFVSDFEQTAIEIAIEKGYDYVVCGHIHQPQMREVETAQGKILYLNSGDWIENLTALEYNNGQWELFHYQEQAPTSADQIEEELQHASDINVEKLYQTILSQ